jgi:hypothetical protein
MSQTQPITIQLPNPIFHQLQEISVTTQQSIEQLITQRLLGTLTSSPSTETQIPAANLHLITSLIKLALSFSPEECQILDRQIQAPDTELDSLFTTLATGPASSSPINLLPNDDTIRQAIAIGLDALAAGQYEDYDEAELHSLFEDIKRNGRLQRGIEL